MQITNVMKYHYAKAVVFSFFNNGLLTVNELQLALIRLAKIYKIHEDRSNDKK